jgi:hypothetical protein
MTVRLATIPDDKCWPVKKKKNYKIVDHCWYTDGEKGE